MTNKRLLGVELIFRQSDPPKSRQDEALYIAKLLAMAVLALAVAVVVLAGGAGLLTLILRLLGG